ncbi:MAG: MotA/TolQ/ExbB proton channel family protein [Planctomycetota bacterium]|jgi:biopolymer transport protein ExbB
MIAIDIMGTLLAQADPEQGATWWETVQSGGVVGYLIMALSVLALALIIMHLVQIRRAALIPPVQLDKLDQHLSQGDVAGALERCYEHGADSYFTRIMAAGLTRYQKSAFGAFEIKDALGVIGSIAPLLGLLGTVLGMVGAFETLSRTATPNHEALAANISLALVTTLMGLILAIPCIALHRYFGNRIDALASEASMEIERLVLHLESTGSTRTTTLPGRQKPAARPEPQPAPPAPAAGKEPT